MRIRDRIFLRDNSIITFAQDKSLVSEEPASQGKGKNTSFYQILDLYIRLDPLQHQFLPENLNLHIEKVLREYISPAVHVQPGKSMVFSVKGENKSAITR